MEGEVEIPSYFVCSISLQLMQDPVTLCTGVTYDRESIEKWIFTMGNNTCPATKQILNNQELIPNHTLRRLIQHWSIANSSMGVPLIATPDPPVDTNQLNELLRDIGTWPAPPFRLKGLKKLRSLAEKSETNRRCIASSEAPAAMISLIESQSDDEDETGCSYDVAVACEEALGILHSLIPLPDKTLDLFASAKCLASVGSILKRGTSKARFHAALLSQTVSRKVLERFVMNASDDLIEGLLEVLTEEVCEQATVAALGVLTAITINSRSSRKKAIEAGAVSALIELLPDQSPEKKNSCERMLCLLDVLCGCTEGTAAMADHAMGIPAVTKKILRVSQLASEKAVRILWSLCQFSSSEHVMIEMLQVGAVAKLCMVLQVDCTAKTKTKAMEILKLRSNCWKNSPCVPSWIF
ncbi:hypothetical protein SUGI_1198120 [Cryptomeria japonica]|uniref:E3 ubiquitin-protein ligase PUB23 n=1 Tax=Cryptomeria japonica TaxID=3369 RepID=UPI002414BCFF|nr:E3 ubiquitin-protein ligase PUB23 [Cryptomeria japonica]GLJ55799.1 hypothetical protein SUGI_1198120 [Cryptomeria japonica]